MDLLQHIIGIPRYRYITYSKVLFESDFDTAQGLEQILSQMCSV